VSLIVDHLSDVQAVRAGRVKVEVAPRANIPNQPAAPPAPPAPRELPPVYYQDQRTEYWIPDQEGNYIRVTESGVRRYLKAHGFTKPELDGALLRIQQTRNVAYASRLAGYPVGCFTMGQKRILVTEPLRLIEPKAGEWPLLCGILNGMLNLDSVDQRPYFYGWLKCAITGLRRGKWMPGQVVAFAGPRESGKSLMQSVITKLLGGRYAKPYLYMSGRTDFNLDSFQSEHLMVEDECESVDIRSRRHFAGHIKQVAANKTHQCHGKNKDGVVLEPLWRMTISLNDDPERLLVLPPIDEDVADKIMLFKVAWSAMPMPTETADQKEAFEKALAAELPAFVHFLLNYEIPKDLRSARYGIKHYHHPELLEALSETTPETRLLNLIDMEIFRGIPPLTPPEYTAIELETLLTRDSSSVRREARNLLTYGTACGSYLGRLAKVEDGRVSRRVLHGTTYWAIQPPPCSKEDAIPEKGEGVTQVSHVILEEAKERGRREQDMDTDTPNSVQGMTNLPHPLTQTTNSSSLPGQPGESGSISTTTTTKTTPAPPETTNCALKVKEMAGIEPGNPRNNGHGEYPLMPEGEGWIRSK
jgi:hypothetical protein